MSRLEWSGCLCHNQIERRAVLAKETGRDVECAAASSAGYKGLKWLEDRTGPTLTATLRVG